MKPEERARQRFVFTVGRGSIPLEVPDESIDYLKGAKYVSCHTGTDYIDRWNRGGG